MSSGSGITTQIYAFPAIRMDERHKSSKSSLVPSVGITIPMSLSGNERSEFDGKVALFDSGVY